MNQKKIKNSKSIDISSRNRFLIAKNSCKSLSISNINHITKKNSFYLDREEIGYEYEQSLGNENINNINSFQINDKKLNNLKKASISKDLEYNYCLTTNSKNDINSKDNLINNIDNVIKAGDFSNNNKEYLIIPKSKIKKSLKNKNNISSNNAYNINNSLNIIFTEYENIQNDLSNNKSIIYNNYKTYEYNIDNNNNENINTQKFSFDEISIVSKINSVANDNINITEEDYFLKDNEIQNNNNNKNKYNLIINNLNKEKLELEEKLRNAYLTNKELKNYIEILKETIENSIIKSGFKDIIDKASKELNKNPINLLIEFNKYKSENEKIKKNLLIQQILTTEMKNDIENFKKENENLIKNNKERKIKNEIKINNIKDNCINDIDINKEDKEECFKNLSKINKELNQNYLNLQNDFSLLNQNNEDIIKYNEKLIKENEQLKKQINYLKELYIKEKDLLYNKENEANKNDINELINKNNNLENINKELNIMIDKQKDEIENMKNTINIKNNEIIQYNNEIQNYKIKEYTNINKLIKEKEEEILILKNENKNIDKYINDIFDIQINQNILKIKNIQIFNKDNNYNNLLKFSDEIINMNNSINILDKLKIIGNFIDLLIKEIVIADKKIIEQMENEKNCRQNANKNIKDKIINEIQNDKNDNEEKNEKEKIINYNNKIINSFEEYSIIKQRENNNNSNYDLYSNNNIIFNNDNEDYNNIMDKINIILSNKGQNEQNKTIPKAPISDLKNKNNNISKSASTKQFKNGNTYNNIIKDNNNKKLYKKNDNNKFINPLEEEKVSNIDKISSMINNNDEKNLTKDNFYITMPTKFNKIKNNYSSTKKNKMQPKINFANISNSNYLYIPMSKNIKLSQGSQTIDSSSRIFTTNFMSINNESPFKKRNNEIKVKNNQVCGLKKYKNFQKSNKSYKKEKQSLVDEVLKPSFLKSDVTSSFLNYYHSNPITSKNKSNNKKISSEIFYQKVHYLE